MYYQSQDVVFFLIRSWYFFKPLLFKPVTILVCYASQLPVPYWRLSHMWRLTIARHTALSDRQLCAAYRWPIAGCSETPGELNWVDLLYQVDMVGRERRKNTQLIWVFGLKGLDLREKLFYLIFSRQLYIFTIKVPVLILNRLLYSLVKKYIGIQHTTLLLFLPVSMGAFLLYWRV